MTDTKDPKEMMKVMQLRPPKLKDYPVSKSRIVINCREQFGFLPELIFIDKVHGSHGHLIISAVVPKEMEERFEENQPMPQVADPLSPEQMKEKKAMEKIKKPRKVKKGDNGDN